MKNNLRMRLGDLLIQHNLITPEQLDIALDEQGRTGRKLGAVLIDLGYVAESQMLSQLADHLHIPLIDIDKMPINPDSVKKLPEIQARRYRALIIKEDAHSFLLGMADPADLNAVDAIGGLLPKTLELAIVSESQLSNAFDNYYRKTEEIASFAEELALEYLDQNEFSISTELSEDQDTAVSRLLQSIFEDAVMSKASDIHIEPNNDMLRIRHRVDGMLQENIINQKNIANALVLRLKLMAGLDISERRLPQDGRAQIHIKNKRIDVRLSTMPTHDGEAVVMRLLDQSAGILSLARSGMPPLIFHRYKNMLSRPNGLILVTGPTGSGKTTTLYGSLSELNTPERKIITVEDPVEYSLPRINQVQVNNKINLDFARVLRTALRQDPDIIMVGEMRDQETAEIGMRGALTGHLVLSTLHTNDSISSAIRLIDMGTPGYLVASALRGVIAQRLVRKICENCKVDTLPSDEHLTWLQHLDPNAHHINFKKGDGCQKCNHTGYAGRVGVFELLQMTEPMMDMLKIDDTSGFALAAKQSPGYKPLANGALDFAKQGITTIEEVLKLVENISEMDYLPTAESVLELDDATV
ncbi:MAG TPA: MSHA biogenesis protein MshE [Glaciecola sp.]|mgnify:FL=1|jgi:MSHA biogenesis protein MshE|nr:MSHA biogenesis protein MshE [Glaciecola sp.]